MARPSVVLISGPNGAGKSSVAPRLLHGRLTVEEFVNADTLARGLSAFRPESVSLDAGRLMIERLRELAAARASFAFETTLASRSFAPWIAKLKTQSYEFHLIFLLLPSADMAVERVRQRVSAGGHNVPEPDIRRRYERGLRNFFTLYQPLATTWSMFDNSDSELHLVANGEGSSLSRVNSAIMWEQMRTKYDI